MNCERDLTAVAGCTLAGVALVYTTASLALCLSPTLTEHAFGMLSIPNRMIPPFADLRAITALAGCSADIDHVMRGLSAGCDPYGRSGGLGYPPLIFALARAFGTSGSWTNPIAITCGVVFISIIIRDVRNSGLIKSHQAWLLAAILVGFPTQLGLERMNIDVAIFIGLRLLVWIREKEKNNGIESWLTSAMGFCAAFVLGGAKVYPTLGVLLWIGFEWSQRRRRKKIDFWIVLGAIAGGLTAIPWMLSGDQHAAPPISLTSHGLIADRGGGTSSVILSIMTISMACLGYAVCRKYIEKNNIDNSNRTNSRYSDLQKEIEWSWIRLSFGTWLISYTLTTSFDYRFIFLYPILIGISAKVGQDYNMNSKIRAVLTGTAVVMVLYMMTPLTYMATEAISSSITSAGGWLHSPLQMTVKYGSAGLSRFLDSIGLPFIAGTSAGYAQSGPPSSKRQ